MPSLVIVVVLSILPLTSTQAADSIVDFFYEGHFSGQVRMYYIDRNFTRSDIRRNGTAIGGHLRYDTGIWHGFSMGAAVYSTNRIFRGLEYELVDPSLFGKDLTSYTFPGEAFINYFSNNTTIKLGRQQLQTPLICGDDARMISCLFEAVNLKNVSFTDVELTAAHILRIAPGTIANTYSEGGVLAVTAGYSFLGAQANNKFHNIGSYAIGQSTPGVTVLGAQYSGFRNIRLQAWNYLAWDFMNALYLQGDVSWKTTFPFEPKLFASGQFILETGIGGHAVLADINSHYWAVLLGAQIDGLSITAAYSQTGTDPDAAIGGGIITTWGGMPAFTQGMVTRHMFMAGTHAWKVQGVYDWRTLGVNIATTVYFAAYDMDSLNGFSVGNEWTATETGVDVSYAPAWHENLNLRFRANFTDDFFQSPETSIGWNEFRFIINYDF